MIDVSLKGLRCRAASEIIDINGTIGAATEGTIVYELEGEGGQLVNVCWDDGSRSLVSSEEIANYGCGHLELICLQSLLGLHDGCWFKDARSKVAILHM